MKKIAYDKKADAIYVYLMQIPVLKSFGIVNKTEGEYPIHFDYTKENKLFGIEILEAQRYFSGKTLDKILRKDKSASIDIVKDLESFRPEDKEEKECIKKVCAILAEIQDAKK